MAKSPNILEVISSGDKERFTEIVDKAFKAAAREASARSYALGFEVADPRADERAVRPASET